MPKRSPLEDHLDRVGVVPDKNLAEEFGLTAEAVRVWRKRRGIEAQWQLQAGEGGPARRRRKSKLDGYRRFLGRRTDQWVAEKAGVSLSNVRAYRYRHSIILDREAIKVWEAELEAKAVQAASKKVRKRKTRKSVLDKRKFRKMLGTTPDQVVAELAGVKLGTVRSYRYRNDIKLSLDQAGPDEAAAAPSTPEAAAAPVVPEAAAAPAPPRAAPSVASRWVFAVTVDVDGAQNSYAVVAADVAEAGANALAGLRGRGVIGEVLSLTRGVEFL